MGLRLSDLLDILSRSDTTVSLVGKTFAGLRRKVFGPLPGDRCMFCGFLVESCQCYKSCCIGGCDRV